MIYDIGANIGQYSLYAAKSLQGRCRVLAFEPEALNYAKLNKNIVLNNLSGTIIPYCLALTKTTILDILYVHSFVPGAAFHSFGKSVKQGNVPFSAVHTQGMAGMSLDDIIARFSLPFPNHMKVDVDGAELLVIQGAGQTLADMRLKSVIIEVYLDEQQKAASGIMDAFRSASFVLENNDAVKQKTGTAPNFIFRRSATAESNKALDRTSGSG